LRGGSCKKKDGEKRIGGPNRVLGTAGNRIRLKREKEKSLGGPYVSNEKNRGNPGEEKKPPFEI